MSQLLFSVVIPTRDRPGALRDCLSRLDRAAQADLPVKIDLEIIVSDDAGHSNPAMTVEFPGVTFVVGPMRGPAANRNHGARRARGDWLVFCDDDCLPDPHWLAAYASQIAVHPEISVFEGAIVADRPKRHPLEEAPINDRGGNLWSCNFAIRRSTFLGLGGFDERFPSPAGEDAELCYRLRQAGMVVKFLPTARVIHPWRRRSATGFLRQQRRLLEADVIAMTIHAELCRHYTPFSVIKDVIRYYLRAFLPEIRQMGLPVLFLQPVMQWIYLLRFIAYARVKR